MSRWSAVPNLWNFVNHATNGQMAGRNCYEKVANVLVACYEDVTRKLLTVEFTLKSIDVFFNKTFRHCVRNALQWLCGLCRRSRDHLHASQYV